MRTQAQTLLPILALGLLSCGGEVHFVSPHVAEVPPSPPVTDTRVTETFFYGQPTGRAVVAFLLYPRKSMRPVLTRLYDAIPAMVRSFWSQATTYSDVRMAVGRDALGGGAHWEQDLKPDTAMLFLRRELTQFSVEKTDGEQESLSPFDQMSTLLQSLTIQDASAGPQVWVHFVYVRDWDLSGGVTADAYAKEAQKRFLAQLEQPPLSKFRYSVHFVAHQDTQTDCLPPDRVTTNLQRYFSGLNMHPVELCQDWSSSLLSDFARVDARLILARVADLSTLEVSLGGQPLAHEQFVFVRATNEVQLTDAAGQVASGEKVEVRYAPQK